MSKPAENPPIDLASCDQEPIHIPGRVQSHGLLMALSEPTLTIVQISGNSAALSGHEPASLLGQPLERLLGARAVNQLQVALRNELIESNPLYLWTIFLPGSKLSCDGVIHRFDGQLILELEPVGYDMPPLDFSRRVRNATARLQRATSFDEFCQATAEEVRLLTGFDRVMVYRFDEDGHGSVIAEAREEALQPFLGLHYPASDIPKQARLLYVLNWLRLIADIGAQPAPLLPEPNPATGRPLDLSFAVLRAVSPIHIEYLHNMGVAASMSLSLVKDGQLWGLIACHHYAGPRYIPYELRAACEFLAQAVSLQIEAKLSLSEQAQQEQRSAQVAALTRHMTRAATWDDGLLNEGEALLAFVGAGGALLCRGGEYSRVGHCPPSESIPPLLAWLAEQPNELFVTERLGTLFPPMAPFKEVASGLLALPLSWQLGDALLWFRPEVLQSVHWAGEPTKAVTITEDGVRLSPRKSFELWKETVRGQSLPWQRTELAAARALRAALTEVVLHKVEAINRLNYELARSNSELDDFAYIASHDLKEPLRGIHNYAHFLLEDHGDKLGTEGHEQIQTLIRLTQRMERLIESLLHYSRLGRSELLRESVALDAALDEALESLQATLQASGGEVRRGALPTLQADPVRLVELLVNLISNALRYNDRDEGRWVEVGTLEATALPDEAAPPQPLGSGPLLYVRDNGIGIEPRHQQSVFRIFRRLHARDAYGGGSGAGLTIVRKIVERHGGQIWLHSEPGVGSTFYFTLQDASA